MIENIKSKLEELELRKNSLKPKIDGFNQKRSDEIKLINQKYDGKIADINKEIHKFKQEIMNDLINSFIDIIMFEFDAKRSTSDYLITEDLKKYRSAVKEIEIFPQELLNKLEKVVAEEEPIEKLAYDIESIKEQYLTS